jgi:hypothetical protein
MTVSTSEPGSYLSRFRNLLRSFFFVPDPQLDFSFKDRELAQLHINTAVATTASIDVQTWDDLLIDQYLKMFSEGVSIFGRQVLYRRLRAGSDETACTEHRTRVKALMADPEQLSRLHQACRPLRRTGIEIASLLFGPQQTISRPAWTRWIGLVGPSFLAAVAATFIWPLAWVAVGIAFALLLAIRFRYIAAIEGWNLSMESLQRLLGVCSNLGESSDRLLSQFAELRGRAGQINRSLSRSPIVVFISAAKDYLDWFMLTNVMHYFRCVTRVDANIVDLRQFFLLIANLEADIALARHLQASPLFCWADRHTGFDIEFNEVVNPLLSHAAPLSIELAGKGAFICGQNGIGKSTLLRTIGLNLVVARAFGFCYARGAAVSTRPVYASMQNEDAMLGGESLYIAELRRATEMLASLDSPHGGIYIIDEIFRGTNHLESVSAATAVLEELASRGLVIVSSHNLVLAPLLAHCLKPLYVSMSNGDAGQLTLLPGVLVQTNGISLLSERGFDARLQTRASEVFDWLNSYLAHPTGLKDIPMAIQA